MKKIQLLVIGYLGIFAGSNCMADEGNLGFGVKGGTLGGGVELSHSVTEDTNVRLGANYLKFSFDSTIDSIDYEMDPDFINLSLMLDWHPFSGSFFICGGAFLTNHEIGVTGKAGKNLIPTEYSQFVGFADTVALDGTVDFNTIAPYAGIGWKSNHDRKGWGVSFDVGVMFQGAPKVSELTVVNAPVDVSGLTELQQYLEEERKKIEDDLEKFQYYPVASLLVTYYF